MAATIRRHNSPPVNYGFVVLIIIFEDAAVDRLRPATLARPAAAITCGSYRLIDVVAPWGPVRGIVRRHLQTIAATDYDLDAPPDQLPGAVTMINARVAPTRGNAQRIGDLVNQTGDVAIVDDHGDLVAARWNSPPPDLMDRWASAAGTLPTRTESWDVFRWPHDIVAIHMASMNESIGHRIDGGEYREIRDGLFVAPEVAIGDHLSIDVSDGPIVLDRGVSIGPSCFLAGPVYAGPRTRVIEHSALKDAVSLGHTVKIGGEVEASIIEPYTNKQHHGFLGHSYLGSWINLGAGTCNSDLKNTYGKINVQYGDEKTATGMQFFGCVIGDYSKTAINTSIFTGKVIGVCSMMYGFVTSNVASYVNYARLFGQTSLLPPEVMIQTQARMFARRKVEQRPCDKQLIRSMYELTEDERAAESELM